MSVSPTAAWQVKAAPECTTAIRLTHTPTPPQPQLRSHPDTHHHSDIELCFLSPAVNFWYDMEYDIKYNYFQLLESLCEVTAKM